MTIRMRRIIALFLLASLSCQPFWGFAENAETPVSAMSAAEGEASEADEQEPVEKYIATSTAQLKVRRGPGKSHSGIDSLPRDSTIYILELGEEWSYVRSRYSTGYVQTKYLTDIRQYNASSETAGSAADVPDNQATAVQTFGTEEEFKQGYKAYAVKNAIIYSEPDDRSRVKSKVPIYDEVIVSHVQGEWSYAKYGRAIGYIRNTSLFKWDRIDPYAGDIPGCVVYPLMAFVNKSTDIISYDSKDKKKQEVLRTINPGSAICVLEPDEQGRYITPYWRTTGYVMEEDIAFLLPVVPYQEAQAGDLVSVMTTYYAVGKHSLQYQGRNWNIYMATTRISDTFLQPGEVFNIYEYIGPYRKSTGYKLAPIASPHALFGYGGGTCQVSTTLYNTLIEVPLLVNHRKVHANSGAKYIPKGFDAAVGGGDINLIFTNTLPYPIRLNFFMSDGVMTCCIFRAG